MPEVSLKNGGLIPVFLESNPLQGSKWFDCRGRWGGRTRPPHCVIEQRVVGDYAHPACSAAYNQTGEPVTHSSLNRAFIVEPLESRLLLTTLPVAPTLLTRTAGTEKAITLTWVDNSDNERGFRLDRWNGRSWGTLTRTKANATSFTDKKLKSGHYYAYRVFAFNSKGISPSSAFIGDAHTLKPGAVLAPSDLFATIVSSSHIALQFVDHAPNEAGYNVEVSNNGGTGPWVFAGYVPGTTDTGVRVFDYNQSQSDKSYAFRIAGYTSMQVSDPTIPVTAVAPISGATAPVFANGQYFTAHIYNDPNATGVLSGRLDAQLRNTDGSIDTSFGTNGSLELGATVIGSGLDGLDFIGRLPNGSILARVLASYYVPNVGNGPAILTTSPTLYELTRSGIVASLPINAGGATIYPIFVQPDGSVVSNTTDLGYVPVNTARASFSSSFFLVTKPDLTYKYGLDTQATPDAIAGLPGGLTAVVVGSYLNVTDSNGNVLGPNTPGALAQVVTPNNTHLTFTDHGTGETSLIIQRSDFASNYIYQDIAVVTPLSAPGTIQFDDPVARDGHAKFYRVFATQGSLISAPSEL